jgi:hypothetical protein
LNWEAPHSTLLGPEGPGLVHMDENWTSGPFLVGITCRWKRYRPYFENYTVDASILDSRLSSLGSQRSDLFRSLVNFSFISFEM